MMRRNELHPVSGFAHDELIRIAPLAKSLIDDVDPQFSHISEMNAGRQVALFMVTYGSLACLAEMRGTPLNEWIKDAGLGAVKEALRSALHEDVDSVVNEYEPVIDLVEQDDD
jgi:hypothetical protein